jgi:hypothetical protein
MRKVNRLRRQLKIEDELLHMLIKDDKIDSESIRTEIDKRFGIQHVPVDTHARFLLAN